MMSGLVACAVVLHDITDPVGLVQYTLRGMEGVRHVIGDGLRRLQTTERSRLLAAAERSAEKVRDASAQLYAPLPALVEIMVPAVTVWLAACGRDQAGARAEGGAPGHRVRRGVGPRGSRPAGRAPPGV